MCDIIVFSYRRLNRDRPVALGLMSVLNCINSLMRGEQCGSSDVHTCKLLLFACRKSKNKPRLLNETQAPTYTGWTADEIQRLREGD